MNGINLTLTTLPGLYAVCRLAQSEAFQPWMLDGEFCSITRTADELSLVLPQDKLPGSIQAETGWRCLKVMGPLDFSLTGILAALSGALAQAGISLFALSTYDTDYILVKDENYAASIEVLRSRGCTHLDT